MRGSVMGKVSSMVVLVAAVLGLVFAAFSTYDFVAHLDRQVHGIHCSFLPGITATDATGASGCHTTMMSPYSSVFRDSVWGGIPVSLPGMGVFAFLSACALWLLLRGGYDDRRSTGFLLAATGVPLTTSAVMAYLAFVTLDAACKLCIGIYGASLVCFVAALFAYFGARPREAMDADTTVPDGPPTSALEHPHENRRRPPAGSPVPRAAGLSGVRAWLAGAVAFGAFVFVPVIGYAATVPDFTRFVGSCGSLAQPDDANGVLVPIGPQGRDVPVVEVMDPLCPACRAFEQRFAAHPAAGEVRRSLLLFPLDDSCNWMVDHAYHPGACAISEAILCAGDRADDVMAWAFAEQEAILAASRIDAAAAGRLAVARFPDLEDCIGSPAAAARLNLALRWAVENQLPVLTPQVYVAGTRMCDADTDLGMDFVLERLVKNAPRSTAPRRVAVPIAPGQAGPGRSPAPRPTTGGGPSTDGVVPGAPGLAPNAAPNAGPNAGPNVAPNAAPNAASNDVQPPPAGETVIPAGELAPRAGGSAGTPGVEAIAPSDPPAGVSPPAPSAPPTAVSPPPGPPSGPEAIPPSEVSP